MKAATNKKNDQATTIRVLLRSIATLRHLVSPRQGRRSLRPLLPLPHHHARSKFSSPRMRFADLQFYHKALDEDKLSMYFWTFLYLLANFLIFVATYSKFDVAIEADEEWLLNFDSTTIPAFTVLTLCVRRLEGS